MVKKFIGGPAILSFMCFVILGLTVYQSDAKAQYLGNVSGSFGLNTQRLFTSQDPWNQPITLLEVTADSTTPELPINAKLAVVSVYQGISRTTAAFESLVSQELKSLSPMNAFDNNVSSWAYYICSTQGAEYPREVYEIGSNSRRPDRLLICDLRVGSAFTQIAFYVHNPDLSRETVLPMTIQ